MTRESDAAFDIGNHDPYCRMKGIYIYIIYHSFNLLMALFRKFSFFSTLFVDIYYIHNVVVCSSDCSLFHSEVIIKYNGIFIKYNDILNLEIYSIYLFIYLF